MPFNTHSTCSYQTTCPDIFFFFVVVFASCFPQHLQRAPHLSEPTAHDRGAAVLNFSRKDSSARLSKQRGVQVLFLFCFFVIFKILKYFSIVAAAAAKEEEKKKNHLCTRKNQVRLSAPSALLTQPSGAVSHASPDNTGRVNNTRPCSRSRLHRESIVFI